MSRLKKREMKNQGSHIAESPPEMSGDIGPGPRLLGAKALAQMVATEPNTCAARRVNAMWTRVKVWSKIIPKPTP
jgi:hypothetical protein